MTSNFREKMINKKQMKSDKWNEQVKATIYRKNIRTNKADEESQCFRVGIESKKPGLFHGKLERKRNFELWRY